VSAITNSQNWIARCISGLAAIAVTAYVVKRLARMRRPLLFDKIDRKDARPKGQNEPIYDYYNFSARRTIAAVRELLQEPTRSTPDAERGILGQSGPSP
jgi:hypothetical protein